MKRTFTYALVLVGMLAGELFSQTAPSGYTTNYRFRKWASGANPSADSLNANWTDIDGAIREPGYTLQDSLIIGASSSPSSVRLYVNGTSRFDSLYISGNLLVAGIIDSLRVSTYSQLGDSAIVGRETIAPGVMRFGDGASGAHRMVAPVLPDRTWDLPAASGTVALTNGDQDFTDMGIIKPDSVHSSGGIRTDGDVWKGTSAYTNPDYVFEDFYTGESSNPTYEGLKPLSEIEAHTKENHRLPGIDDKPLGIFGRADFLLENVEKLYLYIIQQDRRIRELEAKLGAMSK